MQKILIVDNSVYLTGATKSVVSVVSELRGEYSFEFCMDIRGDAAEYVQSQGYIINDFQFVEISKSYKLLGYPFILIWNAAKLMRLIHVQNINIVHVNDLYNQVGVLLKLFNQRVKVVYHVRLTPESYLKPVYPAFVRLIKIFSDAIVPVSKAAGISVVDSIKTTIIPDSLSGGKKYVPKTSAADAVPAKLLYVGNYVRGKGQDYAIKAFADVASEFPDMSLWFVGSGVNGELDAQYVENLQNLIASTDLADRIFFDGQVVDVESVMKESDAVINLSESESFSMVCLEALTFGLPLIATDCGGPSELIQNDVNGILVENRNVKQAANAIRRLASEPGLARRLSLQGPVSAAKFSAASSATILSGIYRNLLGTVK